MAKQLSDRDLRRAYRHFLQERLDDSYPAPEAQGERTPCPDADTLWRLARVETTPEETREVLAHLLRCPRCAGHLQAIRAAQVPALPRWRRRIATLAAVLVLSLGCLFFLLKDGPFAAERQVARGTPPKISSPLDGETLPLGDPFALCWEGAPEGSRFSVWVQREDLEPVLSRSALTEPRLVVDLEELPALVPGDRLLWRVEAETPAGELIESPTFFLTFGPSACCDRHGEAEGLSK